MYQFLITVEYMGIAALVAILVYVFFRPATLTRRLFNIVAIAVLVNELGYSLEMRSRSLEASMVAIKAGYAGKTIAILAFLIFIMHYTKVHMPYIVYGILVFFHTLVLLSVWFYEYIPLYYTSVDFSEEGLFPHVILGHGILYNIFMGLVVVYAIIMLTACVIGYRRAKTSIEHRRIIFVAIMPVISIAGLAIYASGISKGYDTTSLAYAVDTFIIFYAVVKYDLTSQVELAKEVIVEDFVEPVLVLDEREVVYSNKQFRELFNITKFNDEIIDRVISSCDNKTDIVIDGLYYSISRKELVQNRLKRGDIYIMHDVTAEHERIELLDNYNSDLKRDVELKTKDLSEMHTRMIVGIASLIESRDSSTGGHINRTSKVVEIFMKHMMDEYTGRFSDSFCENVIKAAPLHDLGKIAVSDAVLQKPGRYTEEEYEQMKVHPYEGAKIIHRILSGTEDKEFAAIAENVAHYHHEKYDGSGYPNGLSGTEIPIEARIMALADVFDALVSKRCYKEAYSFDKAFAIIEESSGSHFDPQLVKIFLECREELEEFYSKVAE